MLAGAVDGVGAQVRFSNIMDIALNTSNENIVYLAGYYYNNAIRRCDSTNRNQTKVTTFKSISYPTGLVFSPDLKYLYCASHTSLQIYKIEVNTATIIATYGSKLSNHVIKPLSNFEDT